MLALSRFIISSSVADLHKDNGKHIRADQQRETANDNAEVDLMHGELSKNGFRRVACDSGELLLTRLL